MAFDPTSLSVKNPLVYNPLTLPIPVFGSLFGGGDDNNVAEKRAAFEAAPLGAFGGALALPADGEPLDRAQTVNVLPQGQQRNAYSAIFDAFQSIFGRSPTASELAQAYPQFTNTGDPNFTNVSGGNAYVSSLAEVARNNPDYLNRVRQMQLEKDAPQHYGTVNDLFQQSVGRAATSDEQAHFGKLLASGQYDAYTLGQALSQLPESVRKQDEEFRKSLTGELQAQGQQYFEENLLPAIESQFARQGRSIDSSSYAAALAQAGQQQNLDREAFLRNLTAQQYAGSQAAARQDYQDYLNRYYQTQDYGTQRSDYLSDVSRQRLYDVLDYQTQARDYENYLKRYGKRSSTGSIISGGLSGGLGGALLGSKFGPWGALAGGLAGFGLGSYGGSQV